MANPPTPGTAGDSHRGKAAKVVMYATSWCPYCSRARSLLESKQAEFTVIDIERDPALRQEMMARSGRHTVPQIFIGDLHVGGCDDLHALDARGGLDPLLAG
ncbi:MAG: glutaredoxin 3 [Gammaproteobacteria bacterium]|nr:glutaredoxin 3 [Gammaproteobacteria bacterium]